MDRFEPKDIPERLKDLIDFEMDQPESVLGPTAGTYDPAEDKIHLNPDEATVTTAVEELWHRRQVSRLVSKGVSVAQQEENKELYVPLSEIGIIPRIRLLQKDRGYPDADAEFFRYCVNAAKFSGKYLALPDESRQDLKSKISSEPLFDGAAFVIMLIESEGYDPTIWQRIAVKDSEGKKFWPLIEESRQRWNRG